MRNLSDLAVWIVSDGTRGMQVQAEALAGALGVTPVVKLIRPSPLLRAFPRLGRCRLVPPSAGGDPLLPPWPDLVIACGRRNAGAALAVKARSGGRTLLVQIQDPRLDPRLFDLLVIPEHDPTRGANVVLTQGSLNRLAEADLAGETACFAATIDPLPRPRVMVAVGGATRRQPVDPQRAAALLADLARLADSGAGLMITTSRRTPDDLADRLGDLAARHGAALWRGDGANPYLAFLGAAEAIVVTSDSVNMVSEACSTGKPVLVADLVAPKGRIAAFLDGLASRGLTRPFAGRIERYDYAPLDDAAVAGAAVRRLLEGKGLADA